MKKLIVALFMLTSMTYAKTFTSQFTEFELPRGWACQLEGSEWVCQSENEQRKKEAIIILAAKLRGKQDDLVQYKAYLEKVKTFKLPGGKTQVSEPKYTTQIKIATQNHNWIDSLHMASEVPGFFTRYLATVKGELGVAVTFSVAKDHYDSYKPIFDKIVETLKVFSTKKKVAADFKLAGSKAGSVPGSEGDFIDDSAATHNIGMGQKKKSDSGGAGTAGILGLLAVVGIGAAIAMKGKGKKDKKSKKKKKK
jgi:hypothetical protein